ncbi:MAG: DUF2892 domain-containing protein [Luteitalea sp.]|nr:DUF2892 domain-containing protein [Luteitalea sp.]
MMSSAQNVAEVERWASALGGAGIALYGIRQGSAAGAMIAASGGILIARGATGYCPMYAATGVSTADTDTRVALRLGRGGHVEQAATINRSAAELYRYWRNFENLPRFMAHLVSVQQVDQRHSHWVAKAPAGRTVEWDAEIINEIPNELIGWRTVDRADVISAGSVRFTPAGPDRGTEVHLRLKYEPPGGRVGSAVAWMLGHDPRQIIQEDLRRFKQLMEAGEVPTTKGQPRGKQSILNYD